MKNKIIILFLTFALLSLLSISAFATDPILYSDNIVAVPGESVSIPINIKNCDGMMGFKLTLEYDASVLNNPKLLSGSATKSGLLDNNISNGVDGSFDIVWAGTSDFKGKGTLFILNFDVSENAKDKTTLKFNCSSDDTFNEKYENVLIDCSEIVISFGSEAVTALPIEAEPNSSDVVYIIDSVIQNFGVSSIDAIPAESQSEFINQINEKLPEISGNTSGGYSSYEEVRNDYIESLKEDYINDVLLTVDGDKINESISFALNYYGFSSADEVTDDKKEEFVLKIEEKLSEYNPELNSVSARLSADDSFDTIMRLQSENENMNYSDEGNGKKIWIAASAIVLVLIAFAISIFKIKKSKSKEEFKENENS